MFEDEIMKIADYYGYESQSHKCIEEMGELTQAICKFRSGQLADGDKGVELAQRSSYEFRNLVEELADVKIMIEQMIDLLDCETMVDMMMRGKLDRTIERMAK